METTFELPDLCEETPTDKTGRHFPSPIKVSVTDEVDGRSIGGLGIRVPGYGVAPMEPGFGHPIFLEIHNGELRLLVWADIHQEEPTHVISLVGARTNNFTISPVDEQPDPPWEPDPFCEYLEQTLILDLRIDEMGSTANDFATAVEFIRQYKPLADRAMLAREVYLKLYDSVESFELLDGVGAHFAYLLGAIVSDEKYDVDIDDPVQKGLMAIVHESFPPEHAVYSCIEA